jgi:hypothetical protein
VQIEVSITGGTEDGETEEDGNRTETEATTATRAAPTRTTTTRSDPMHFPLCSSVLIRALVTIDQINAVLGSHGPLRRLLLNHYRRDRGQRASDDDDDEYVSGYGGFAPRRRRPKVIGDKFPKIPSEQGKALMNSGLYGYNEHFVDRRRKRKNNVSERLLWRKLGLDARGSSRRANRYIAQVCPLNTLQDYSF